MQRFSVHDHAAVLQLLAVLEARARSRPDAFEAACLDAVSGFVAASAGARLPFIPRAQAAGRAAAVKRPLTRRESEVMRWLACGKTDADIGVILAISPRTVHKHLEHIYEKLGVETRTAAVMRVFPPAG